MKRRTIVSYISVLVFALMVGVLALGTNSEAKSITVTNKKVVLGKQNVKSNICEGAFDDYDIYSLKIKSISGKSNIKNVKTSVKSKKYSDYNRTSRYGQISFKPVKAGKVVMNVTMKVRSVIVQGPTSFKYGSQKTITQKITYTIREPKKVTFSVIGDHFVKEDVDGGVEYSYSEVSPKDGVYNIVKGEGFAPYIYFNDKDSNIKSYTAISSDTNVLKITSQKKKRINLKIVNNKAGSCVITVTLKLKAPYNNSKTMKFQIPFSVDKF